MRNDLSVAAIGYLVAASCYLALAFLLATRWRGRVAGSLLLPAVAVSGLWALANAEFPADRTLWALCAEVARALIWIELLARALRPAIASRFSSGLRLLPWVIAGVAVALGVYGVTARESVAAVATVAQATIASGLGLSLAGVILVEQALRNTREAHAWELKPVWIAAAAQFGYDIALYSASYALGGLEDTLYAARGFAAAALVPILGVGVSRLAGYRPQTFMSQRLAFYTTSVLISGAYLVAVSVAAYYVRAFGGRWGDALQVLLVFGALIGLASLLLSRALRARVRVLVAKHLLPYKYDFRNEWLDLTARLTNDADGSSLAQRTIDAFIRLTHVRSGVLFTLKDGVLLAVAGENFQAFAGVSEPISGAFCQSLTHREWILDLDRARAKVGRDGEVPVPAWLTEARETWLAVPLIHEKQLCGLVVLRRPFVIADLTWEDLDLIRTAARQAASYVALDISADALARERQFAALNRLTAFLMHDLSNVVAQQQLIVKNAARHRENPAFFDDAIQTIENTVHRLSRLLDQLKAGSAEAPLPKRVDLADVCEAVVVRLSDRRPAPTLLSTNTGISIVVSRDRFEHVLEHLIRNAQDATPADGTLTVTVVAEAGSAVIRVSDSGVGMTQEFIRGRLFRPFDTTKGAKGMGIGAFQVREFILASGGEIEVTSVPGKGTAFVIRLPLAA